MFQTYLVQPIYNVFIFLVGVMPAGDVGFAIIVLTLIIRVVFYPLFASSIRTQMGMQALQGDIDEINKKYKDDPEQKNKKTMELFREHKVRPLSAIFALLVQIPVFFALYVAFFKEGLPHIAADQLYSFVHAPAIIHTNFLGILDLLAKHSIPLALVVFGLQYVLAHYSLSRIDAAKKTQKPADANKEMAQKMQRQMMLYFLPTLMGVVSYSLPSAVGLYFAAGNIVSLGQEWLIKREFTKQ